MMTSGDLKRIAAHLKEALESSCFPYVKLEWEASCQSRSQPLPGTDTWGMWICHSQSLETWEISFCDCGILLRQPEHTKTDKGILLSALSLYSTCANPWQKYLLRDFSSWNMCIKCRNTHLSRRWAFGPAAKTSVIRCPYPTIKCLHSSAPAPDSSTLLMQSWGHQMMVKVRPLHPYHSAMAPSFQLTAVLGPVQAFEVSRDISKQELDLFVSWATPLCLSNSNDLKITLLLYCYSMFYGDQNKIKNPMPLNG